MSSVPQSNTPDLVLDVRNVEKNFGATRALGGASLQIRQGEVHALVGENGAGKSTMIKVLAGAHRPDSGEIHWLGQPYAPADPLAARDAGIATCHQELSIAPHLTVTENILLGQELSSAGWIRRGASRKRVEDLLHELDQASIPAGARAGSLSLAQQQFTEIARAMASQARLIILDEPTSALTRDDTHRLFALIRKLRDQGVSFLYVSHFLEELMAICDRFTVMRDGKTVAQGEIAQTSIDELVSLMVGRRMEELYPRIERTIGPPLLRSAELAGADAKPDNATFTLHEGEIIGFGGLVGSGRSELLRTLYGLRAARGGSVSIELYQNEELLHATPARRVRRGMGFASEDRKEEGLALGRSLAENIALPAMRRAARWGFINRRRLRGLARDAANQLKAVYREIEQPARDLSGGNQQKIALARLLYSEARVMLLDEPTRGVDVGSKAIIYEWLGREAKAGKAIVITSSYLPELLGVCDRIGVMYRGRIAALAPRAEWTEEKLLLAATTGANPFATAAAGRPT